MNNWISVKDRLPDGIDDVLVTDKYDVRVGYYHSNWNIYSDELLGYEITHWQPLPKAPEGE
jgi:hypothetical protein